MINSFMKLPSILTVALLISSCHSNHMQTMYGKTPVSTIESTNGKIVFFFPDKTMRSFTMDEVGFLLKEKKITENTYVLCFQKMEEEKIRTGFYASASSQEAQVFKDKHYKLDDKPFSSIQLKNGKFIFHLTDNTTRSFSMDEVGCLVEKGKITEETYLFCFQKNEEHKILNSGGPVGFSFNYREADCNAVK